MLSTTSNETKILQSPERSRRWLRLAMAAALHLASVSAVAAYPEKAVRVVVPYQPGGGLEVVGRALTQRLSETFKQQFIIENRPGAGATIGANVVAKAPADGYTLLLTLAAITVSPSVYANLPFDPTKDFSPIALVTSSSSILSVHPSVPVRTIKDFITLAKTSPGKLNYATSGTGGDMHLSAEQFFQMAGIKLTHIPYNGGGPAIIGILRGEVDAMFVPGSFGYTHIQSGRLRPVALVADKRSPVLPNLPTLAEAGFSGFEKASWSALLGPKGTPPEVVATLNGAVSKILADDKVRSYYTERFLQPLGGTPDQLATLIRTDVSKWRRIATQVGITPE